MALKTQIKIHLSTLLLAAVVMASFSGATNAYGSANGRIVYTGNPDGVLSGDIFIMNPDGSGRVNLTNSPDSEGNPSWSPDGSKILFIRGDSPGGDDNIFTMNPDGSEVTNVTNDPSVIHIAPIWSPDGKYIRFISKSLVQTDKYATFIVKPDGTGLTEMPILINPDGSGLDGWAYYFQPWSPDSSRIIITETFSGGMRLHTIKPDGTDPVQISGFLDGYNWAYAQSWSPDSSKIFYSEFGDGTSTSQKVVNASDGSTVSQQSIARGSAPGISIWPTESEIVYSAKEDGDTNSINLFKTTYSGSNFSVPTKLTSYSCADGEQECGVFIFDIAQSRVAFSEVLPQDFNGATTDIFAIDNYSNPLNLTNHTATEQTAKLALISYNVMEPTTPPPAATPSPPKTGKLIGAMVASASLFAIIFVIAKEFKLKNHDSSRSYK